MINVLTIAGSDPLSGAGVQGDLKTMAALGVYGLCAITAITAQNSQSVSKIEGLTGDILKDQLESIANDVPIHGVKIGMIYSSLHIEIIRDFLMSYKIPYVVIDPILRATTGQGLIQEQAIEKMLKQLFPLATLITPNIEEASSIVGQSITTLEEAIEAGKKILTLGAKYILVKGGHFKLSATDTLIGTDLIKTFTGTQINKSHTHGTGCALSTAITCYLAKGYSIESAVKKSKEYVFGAIKYGKSIGNSYGPINHFWQIEHKKLLSDEKF